MRHPVRTAAALAALRDKGANAEATAVFALPAPRAGGPTAFLTVQEGCDKFCTFCVVPYTRGAEFSRPAAKVLAEAERLVEAGARELTLLGQNVNAWHGMAPDGTCEWSLGRLIRALDRRFPGCVVCVLAGSAGGGAAGVKVWVGTTDPGGSAAEGDIWVKK